MPLLPNLNGKLRGASFIAGAACVIWGLYWADASWARITWLAAGGALCVMGIIGFCPFLWILGVRGSAPE
jgi:hypothetical protein